MFFYFIFIQATKSILEVDLSLKDEKTYKLVIEDIIALHLDEKMGHSIISGSDLEIKTSSRKSLSEYYTNWYTLKEQSHKNEFIFSKDFNDLAIVLIKNKDSFDKTIKVTTGPFIVNTEGYINQKNDVNYQYDGNYTKLSDTPKGKSKKKNNSIGLYVSIGVLAFYGLALIIIVIYIIVVVVKEACSYQGGMSSSRGEDEDNIQRNEIDDRNDAYDQNEEVDDVEKIDTPNMLQYENPYAQPVEANDD